MIQSEVRSNPLYEVDSKAPYIPNLYARSSLNGDNVCHQVFDVVMTLLLFVLQDKVSFEPYNYDDI
jgi:hypothetical protein